MWKRIFRTVMIAAAAGLVTGLALGQSSTQGAISGTVVDASAAAVPKASVTIHHLATNRDIQVQQQLGKGTAVQVAYLGALARELPNFLNVNLDPTTLWWMCKACGKGTGFRREVPGRERGGGGETLVMNGFRACAAGTMGRVAGGEYLLQGSGRLLDWSYKKVNTL